MMRYGVGSMNELLNRIDYVYDIENYYNDFDVISIVWADTDGFTQYRIIWVFECYYETLTCLPI